MSFDIFLQAFERGDAADRNSGEVRRLIAAASPASEPESEFARLTFGDGEADVYGVPADGEPLEGLMFNHVTGDSAFDLMFSVAAAADLVIMPVGCPRAPDRPASARTSSARAVAGPVTVVRSGREILTSLERA